MGNDSPLPPEPRRRRRTENTRGDYRVYRAGSPSEARPRRRPLPPREGRPIPAVPPPPPPRDPGRRQRRGLAWRVAKWAVLAVAGWTALSVVLFLFSAQVLQDRV
ncbi:MAG: hypothetical protein ACKOTH_04805, partial [Solirubrobacterales bacterium]